MADGGTIWMSTRAICRSGDPKLDDLVRFKGLPPLREVRSIDSWLNPCVEGHYGACSLDQMWEMLDLLFKPPGEGEYHLLFTDALAGGLPEQPRLKLLGHDLSDETWTSSPLNCGNWLGELEPIARRVGENGLLGLEDAKLAKALLPDLWPGDPHGLVTVWALFEIVPEREG
jgi:hypothetical protein